MPMNARLLRPTQNQHPEAADWANRVRANGGTVSGSTLLAVSRFCRAIDAAGIRDRFFRLNLFCGNSDASLNAVRTPLYRGQSRTGTQFGNTTDTNNNFVEGDYAENNGLLGNGSTKWLNTGFNANAAGLTTSSVHLSAVWPQYSHPASSTYQAISIHNAAVNDRYYVLATAFGPSTTRVECSLGQTTQTAVHPVADTNGATVQGGLWVASRTSTTNLRFYRGSTELASNTSNIAASALPSTDMAVFVRWNGSAFFGYSAARLRAYSAGLGMAAQQVADFNNAMTALQTALGRT